MPGMDQADACGRPQDQGIVMEALKHALTIIGAGAVVLVLGMLWLAWRDARSRSRYFAENERSGTDL